MDELVGPSHGTAHLPLHIAWSGRTVFDLEKPKQRMSVYRTVLVEGQRDDLMVLLNKDLLTAQWPFLRNLVSRTIREVWESAFTELAAVRPATTT
ncbi:hypothetical protein [Actinomadura hibisca]|uniref:hypothetical protein n=1 Tax=Actinomadura hibisca TaxID=68565 RepID=UPI001C3F1F65|nr:hypothetical protein [Actinomadura hibisca]